MTNAGHEHKHLTPAVKHGGGGLRIWAGFAVTELTVNSKVQCEVICLTDKAWSKLGQM